MYNKEFKEQIIQKYIEGGRTGNSLADEFGLSRNTVRRWIAAYKKECAMDAEKQMKLETMEENRRLKEELEELKKENDFLKKAAAFFARKD